MQHIKNNSVNHTFTSPPYNRKRNDKYNFYDDRKVDYLTFISESIKQCLRVTKGYVFFNIQKNFYNKEDVFKIIGLYYDKIIDIIIWNKDNPMPANGLNVTNSYEFILVLSNNHKSIKSNYTYTKNQFFTEVYSSNKYKHTHRAVMNPKACRFVLSNFTKEGDIILDPFMGVGTTALECVKMGRRFIGFEIEKEYCKIINKRLNEVHNEK